jgi:hypothetical protein
MKKTYLECDCDSAEHIMRLSYFEDDKDYVYLEIHLSPLGFWSRLINAAKYIFGYRSAYGDFSDMVLGREKVQQLRDCCDEFLGGRWEKK